VDGRNKSGHDEDGLIAITALPLATLCGEARRADERSVIRHFPVANHRLDAAGYAFG
jgi:hypothetical protein